MFTVQATVTLIMSPCLQHCCSCCTGSHYFSSKTSSARLNSQSIWERDANRPHATDWPVSHVTWWVMRAPVLKPGNEGNSSTKSVKKSYTELQVHYRLTYRWHQPCCYNNPTHTEVIVDCNREQLKRSSRVGALEEEALFRFIAVDSN